MTPLQRGDPAPSVPGADGPTAVVFYKVTCPTCQMAAPPMERLHRAYADRFVAVAQDPPGDAEVFAREHGLTFPTTTDAPPFELSRAFGIEVVPTVVVVADGRIEGVAESWDREAWNEAAARLAELLGTHAVPVSEEGDGLPPFRPG